MCSQQAYPSFTPNHDNSQEGFEDYYQSFRDFFSPAMRTDGGDLEEHRTQVTAWNHAPQLEPPGHLNLCTPPNDQLKMETPSMVESWIMEPSADSDGSLEEESHPVLQYYPHDWTPAFWPESPDSSSQTHESEKHFGAWNDLTLPNQSPNMPIETLVANVESSHCSSATTQEVTKESHSLASQTLVANVESSRCSSATTQEVTKESNSLASQIVVSNVESSRCSSATTQEVTKESNSLASQIVVSNVESSRCSSATTQEETQESDSLASQTVVSNMESSRCSSATIQEVTQESDSLTSQTVTVMGTQEKTLSDILEDVLEMLSETEMEKFAKDMKQKRFDMGFSQADVCFAVKVLYGKELSQTIICRFESVQLSYRNMCRIRPFLERWLEDTEKNEGLQKMIRKELALASRKRRQRAILDKIARDSLEIFFRNDPKPDHQQLEQIAKYLNVEYDVVHMWFCNRRQTSLFVKEPSNKNYEPQLLVPHVGVFSRRQMPFPGYMSWSPPMYNPAFHYKNMYQ